MGKSDSVHAPVNFCDVCGDVGSLMCNRCETASYCSKDHQRQHWNDHVAECRSFKIKESPEAGQYVYEFLYI